MVQKIFLKYMFALDCIVAMVVQQKIEKIIITIKNTLLESCLGVTRKHLPPVRGPPYGPSSRIALRTGAQTTPTDPLYGPSQNNMEIKINKVK